MPDTSSHKLYHCGTLTYTRMGLFSLFSWLLWGDFCYILMEMVVPNIVPLQMRELDAPNWAISLFLAAIPNLFNMTFTPYISVKSDRCRSRWGRRIPFIAASIPFISMSMLMLAFSKDIADFCGSLKMFAGFTPATLMIGAIGIFFLFFQFFHLMINTGFNALFNDVVPPSHLARFFAFSRMLGTAVGAFYNFVLFQYSLSHFKEIFAGVALLYFIAFTLMIFKVKEGEYPPLDASQREPGRWKQLKIFFSESFQEPLYRLLCYSGGILAFAGIAWSFNTFYRLEMKMSLAQLGTFNGILSIGSFFSMYFAATFVDRWHPLRVYTYSVIFTVIGPMMNWVWLFIDMPGELFFALSLASALLFIFMNSLSGACALPLQMRLFPKSRYSQFCSAQGIIASICRIIAGIVVGFFYDGIRWYFARYGAADTGSIQAGSGYCYRFYFIWAAVSCLANFIVIALAYRRWLKLGGDAGYHPPASWNPAGYELNELVPTSGLQSRYLKLALTLFDCTIHGSLILAVGMCPVLYGLEMSHAANQFLWYVIPASLLVSCLWYVLARGIRRDIRLAQAGEMPVNGLPHHGMMLVFAIKFLLTLGLVIGQFRVSIYLNNGFYVLLFALSNIITNILLLLCTFTVIKMEKGYSTKVDETSAAIWETVRLRQELPCHK